MEMGGNEDDDDIDDGEFEEFRISLNTNSPLTMSNTP